MSFSNNPARTTDITIYVCVCFGVRTVFTGDGGGVYKTRVINEHRCCWVSGGSFWTPLHYSSSLRPLSEGLFRYTNFEHQIYTYIYIHAQEG